MPEIKLPIVELGGECDNPLPCCSNFDALVIEVNDPSKTNDSQFIQGTLGKSPYYSCINKKWHYEICYSDAVLTDPGNLLTQADIKSIGCGETLNTLYNASGVPGSTTDVQLVLSGDDITVEQDGLPKGATASICDIIAANCPPPTYTLDVAGSIVTLNENGSADRGSVDICALVAANCPGGGTGIVETVGPPGTPNCTLGGVGGQYAIRTIQAINGGADVQIGGAPEHFADVVGDARTANINQDISGIGTYEPAASRTPAVVLNNPSTCRSMIYRYQCQLAAQVTLREFGQFRFFGTVDIDGGGFSEVGSQIHRYQNAGEELIINKSILILVFAGGTLPPAGSITITAGIGVETQVASPTVPEISELVSTACQVEIIGATTN